MNSQLLQGPDINTSLSTVLLRFREGEIGFTADVESMFYAFHLQNSDRDFTRFFWWKDNNPNLQLVEFRATRHIFGKNGSPCLANLGLRYAVVNSEHSTPKARDFVFKNFYVDDGCGSADTVDGSTDTLKETIDALASYNIHLHKICSSSDEVLHHFPTSELAEKITKDFNHLENQRTLGVEWDPTSDSFIMRTNVPRKSFTKRGTLATTNSLFDPLGFVAPISIQGRLLQRILIPSSDGDPNILKLDWDDPLPESHLHDWEEWTEALRQNDGRIAIPRGYTPLGFGHVMDRTMHVFCDASESGLGFVIYLRSVNETGKVQVAFALGNSRVPPRKSLSIPRLELNAAVNAAHAAYKLSEDLNMDLNSISMYSDSQVVLGYITNRCRRFSRYVTRRVDLIVKAVPAQHWQYIKTDENPGDIASRPQSFDSLVNSCWFRGPPFLWEENLSSNPPSIGEVNLPESINDVANLKVVKSGDNSLFSATASRVSSWSKLIKVTQIVINFVSQLFEKVRRKKGIDIILRSPCTSKQATTVIISGMQRECFPQYFGKKYSPNDKLSTLAPFIDESDSLLRVGGRLKHHDSSEEFKHPILLARDSRATELIIGHHHEVVKHAGRVVTTASLRNAGYYIQSGSKVIKKFISKCVLCRKLRAECCSQKMSDLPHDRLKVNPPFTYTGLDVFGPFHITEGATTRRTNSSKKLWAIVFVCLVSKAVHIETLSQMDTNSFKLALRRFLCLRGSCRKLRSDCGTNFLGAHNQDNEVLNLEAIKDEASQRGCDWEFNPPNASHFGGLWERAIRSIRKTIDASLLLLGKRRPSREELNTILQEASSIINNTPMYEISNDPNDELPLTPANLLTMKSLPNPPPLESFTEKDVLAYGRRRWRRVQAVAENFWQRWRSEYIQELQKRQKWNKMNSNIEIDDIVLLKVKKSKRNCWPLGKIKEVKTSSDGLVRSVVVKTSSGEFRRPISSIVPILRGTKANSFE